MARGVAHTGRGVVRSIKGINSHCGLMRTGRHVAGRTLLHVSADWHDLAPASLKLASLPLHVLDIARPWRAGDRAGSIRAWHEPTLPVAKGNGERNVAPGAALFRTMFHTSRMKRMDHHHTCLEPGDPRVHVQRSWPFVPDGYRRDRARFGTTNPISPMSVCQNVKAPETVGGPLKLPIVTSCPDR